MNTTTIRKAGTSAALLVAFAAAPLLLADSALAQGGGGSGGGARVQSTGTCTGGGHFKLKAKHDSGRIEVEYEVDTNRVGQAWAVRLTDNGVTVFNGALRTTAPSGSFSVHRLVSNRAGTDKIRAMATRGANSCGGAVSL